MFDRLKKRTSEIISREVNGDLTPVEMALLDERDKQIQERLDTDYDMSRRKENELREEQRRIRETLNLTLLIKKLPEALEASMYSFQKDQENPGYYQVTLDAGYDEVLEDRTIARIIDSISPADYFYEELEDMYEYARWSEVDQIESRVTNRIWDLGVDLNMISDEAADVLIRNYVNEHVDVLYPVDHYLDQEVETTIIMDTGDGNYEYTVNAQYPSTAMNAASAPLPEDRKYETYDPKTFIPEYAGIAWLAKTQGYTREQLHLALENDCILTEEELRKLLSYAEPSPHLSFLKSMRWEMVNSSSCTPAVTFLVTMTLRQLLVLNQLIRAQDRNGRNYDATKNPPCGHLTIGKDTMAGLFDFISGGGSTFEIMLEKDIDIPISLIRSATPDYKCQGICYPVGEVYGMSASAWKDTVKHMGAPKSVLESINTFDAQVALEE